MAHPEPFPAEGITLVLGSPDGGKPTKDWIGKPSEQDVQTFLWFLLADGNVATRIPAVGGHQKVQMHGNFCTYGLRTPSIRGSDLTRRIYACIRVLEFAGVTNWQACKQVAGYLGDRLGKTKRGRRPKTSAPPDLFNKAYTVRNSYHLAKKCHRWKEKLPERDLELENWWGLFLHFKEWAQATYATAVEDSQRRGISIETLCQEIQARSGRPGAVICNVIRTIYEIRSKEVATQRGSVLKS